MLKTLHVQQVPTDNPWLIKTQS